MLKRPEVGAALRSGRKSRLRASSLLAAQAAATLILFVLADKWWGSVVAEGVLFGAMAALANSGLLLWRMRRAENHVSQDAHRDLRLLLRTALERFVLVVALLAIGMGSLKQNPLAVVTGFVAGQLIWLFGVVASGAGWRSKPEQKNI